MLSSAHGVSCCIPSCGTCRESSIQSAMRLFFSESPAAGTVDRGRPRKLLLTIRAIVFGLIESMLLLRKARKKHDGLVPACVSGILKIYTVKWYVVIRVNIMILPTSSFRPSVVRITSKVATLSYLCIV